MTPHRMTGILFTFAALLSACAGSTWAAQPGGSGGQSASPYTATGRVVDAAGRPLTGAEVEVHNSVYMTSVKTRVGANGQYTVKVPDGSWRVLGTYNAQFDGKTYCLQLKPDDTEGFWAADGAVRNLSLAIQGANAHPDGSPYGGKLDVELRGFTPGTYQGTVTLVPQGPLMDGSTGRTIALQGSVDIGGGGMAGFTVQDISLGKYAVTAELTDAAGAVTAVRVRVDNDSPHRGTNIVTFDGGFLTCGEELRSNLDLTPES